MDGEPVAEQQGGLVLTEQLPQYDHLTLADIRKVVGGNYGLRTTNPKFLDAERTNGVAMGDFILLYDVSTFLDLDRDKFKQPVSGELERQVIQKAFMDNDLDFLIGLDALPQRYEAGLKEFFEKNAILAVSARGQVTPEMTLEDYIKTLEDETPALLIVQDNQSRRGYDNSFYGGFSKRGRAPIPASMFVDTTRGIEDSDKKLLKKRYAPYLQTRFGDFLSQHQVSPVNLFATFDKDIATMLTGKTVAMLKNISPTTPVSPH
jgi:hypothetical protein